MPRCGLSARVPAAQSIAWPRTATKSSSTGSTCLGNEPKGKRIQSPYFNQTERIRTMATINIDELSEAELIDLNHRVVDRLRFLSQMRAHSQMLLFILTGIRLCSG